MRHEPTHLDRFVTALHRRMLLLRFIERLGIAILVGCGLLAVLMPFLIWRGQTTGALVAGVFTLSLLCGAIWALTDRPTHLRAAIEADRQLRLSDLLSTAIAMGPSDDEFTRIVLATAQARCAAASPSSVILNKLGARSWGGIALATILIGIAAAMTSDSPRTQLTAATTTPRTWQELEDQRLADEANATARSPRTPDYRRPKTGTGGDDNDSLKSSTPMTPDNTIASGQTTPADNQAGSSNDGTGAGAGTSATAEKTTTTITPTAADTRNTGAGPTTSTGGQSTTATTVNDNVNATGSTAAPKAAPRPAPPWQSEDWPAMQEQVKNALQQNRIPAAYQDLVRDYFAK